MDRRTNGPYDQRPVTIDYVPAALGLPDSFYTASSIHPTNWYPYHMRLGHALGWMPEGDDTFPWFQIDLLNVYTMIDLYLRNEFDFYVILFHLKASIDGSTHYLEQNIVPDYLANEVYSTYWFDNARRVASRTPVRTCVHIVRESKKKYDPSKKEATS